MLDRSIGGALGLAAVAHVVGLPASVGQVPQSPPAPRGANKVVEIGGQEFRLREADHFTIAYNTPYNILRPLIGRLEGTFDAVWGFCERAGLVTAPPGDHLRVILFDHLAGFHEYRAGLGLDVSDTATGFYWPETNVAAFVNTLSTPEVARITDQLEKTLAELRRLRKLNPIRRLVSERRRRLKRQATTLRIKRDAIVERFNRFVLQHEAAHQILFNLGVHGRGVDNPPWLVEGLACQFEVPQDGATGRIKGINQMRLADLRDALGIGPHAKSCPDAAYQAALASRRLLHLSELIAKPDAFAHAGENVVFRYAQAWSMVYYLQRTNPTGFHSYLRMVSARRPGIQADAAEELGDFTAALGPVDRRLEDNWLRYTVKLRYRPRDAGR
ncbi:MAG: DUF1570 domain-containing protein [Phycisphaerae bacterium]